MSFSFGFTASDSKAKANDADDASTLAETSTFGSNATPSFGASAFEATATAGSTGQPESETKEVNKESQKEEPHKQPVNAEEAESVESKTAEKDTEEEKKEKSDFGSATTAADPSTSNTKEKSVGFSGFGQASGLSAAFAGKPTTFDFFTSAPKPAENSITVVTTPRFGFGQLPVTSTFGTTSVFGSLGAATAPAPSAVLPSFGAATKSPFEAVSKESKAITTDVPLKSSAEANMPATATSTTATRQTFSFGSASASSEGASATKNETMPKPIEQLLTTSQSFATIPSVSATSTTATKPAFSFGAAAPASSEASGVTNTSDVPPKCPLPTSFFGSFARSDATDKTATKVTPSFSFGAASTPTASLLSSVPPTSIFAVTKDDDKPDTDATLGNRLGFSFGTTSSFGNATVPTTTSFSFGSSSPAKLDEKHNQSVFSTPFQSAPAVTSAPSHEPFSGFGLTSNSTHSKNVFKNVASVFGSAVGCPKFYAVEEKDGNTVMYYQTLTRMDRASTKSVEEWRAQEYEWKKKSCGASPFGSLVPAAYGGASSTTGTAAPFGASAQLPSAPAFGSSAFGPQVPSCPFALTAPASQLHVGPSTMRQAKALEEVASLLPSLANCLKQIDHFTQEKEKIEAKLRQLGFGSIVDSLSPEGPAAGQQGATSSSAAKPNTFS